MGSAYAHTPPTGGVARDGSRTWIDRPDLAGFRSPYPEGVVSQGDLNLANFLYDGKRVRIVDFEDGGRSDVAMELGTLVEHIAARETYWDAFCSGFDVPGDRLLAARRGWAIFWLQMLLPGGTSAKWNPPEVLEEQARRLLGLLG